MPQSMTAFARVTHQDEWGSLSWEIRSVNHRYLEAALRMPETLRDLEMPLRELARQRLHRGKVDCTVQLALNRDLEGLVVNTARARQYIDAALCIAELMPGAAAISPMDILDHPGVLEQRQLDSDALKQQCRELFIAAVDQLVEIRALEGAKLADFIRQRLTAIAAETARIRTLMPAIIEGQRTKLRERVADLQLDLDPQRLEQEIALLAQKADVAEELDRLDAHLSEIRRVLDNREPIGRRLDFLMQELNREANTLSSKSIALDTTQAAVELKVLIEQMREQIQNIE
ncbi:MAG: YicC/YloC family endoribonuclease [Pseudomonadota bacterium]|nr:YicC/YloC family endoribonuclease [Pseudomonadota bacterium]